MPNAETDLGSGIRFGIQHSSFVIDTRPLAFFVLVSSLEIVHDVGVRERRRVPHRAPFRDVAQQAAHDLPRARLRQVRREEDVVRPGNGADLLDDVRLQLVDHLKEHVVRKIGAIARPDDILFAADLPKTRSGKIMRRLLRDIAEGKALGDTTTLADPTVVAKLKEKYEEEH